ncbi:hypothetical protein ACFLWB_00995 [Chloroflexota bacterium]
MKERARQVLQNVIEKLDEAILSSESGSWKLQVERVIESADDRALSQEYNLLNVLMDGQQAKDNALAKVLVGENILSPSLVSRRWQFLKQPLLAEKEKEAIESAVVLWTDSKAIQFKALRDSHETSPNKDDLVNRILFLASMLDIYSSCSQQLSTDLKMILTEAE